MSLWPCFYGLQLVPPWTLSTLGMLPLINPEFYYIKSSLFPSHPHPSSIVLHLSSLIALLLLLPFAMNIDNYLTLSQT